MVLVIKPMRKIIIINGPNLNLLGKRETEIYGTQTFESFFETLKATYKDHADLVYYQSNHEGSIIDKLHEVGCDYDGIILNAGAYTHTSIAIHDAIKGIITPVHEVHISDISQREAFRKHSYVSLVTASVTVGKGLSGYNEAIDKVLI